MMILSLPTPLSRLARRLRAGTRRFATDRSGVTAIEFAAVAPVFFGLLLSIIETGVVFAANSMLENAVYTASRQVLTGQLQSFRNGGATASATYCKFLNSVCSGMSSIMSPSTCLANIQIDFKVHSAGTPLTADDLAVPITASGALDTTKLDRGSLGGPGSYMLIRAYYQYPVYLAYMGGGVGASDDGKRLLIATMAMAVEPFPGSGTSNDASLATASCSAS